MRAQGHICIVRLVYRFRELSCLKFKCDLKAMIGTVDNPRTSRIAWSTESGSVARPKPRCLNCQVGPFHLLSLPATFVSPLIEIKRALKLNEP